MLGCLGTIVQMIVALAAEFVQEGCCGFTLVVERCCDGFAGDWVKLNVCCVVEIRLPSDYRCAGGSASCCVFVGHLRLVLPDVQQFLCFAGLNGLWDAVH